MLNQYQLQPARIGARVASTALACLLMTVLAPRPAESGATYGQGDTGSILAMGALPAGSASYGGCWFGCGSIFNHTNSMIDVARDWCDSPGGPCNDSPQKTLSPGQHTPGNEDWDAWYTPDGCRDYALRGTVVSNLPWTVGSGWHRLHNPEDLHIMKRSC